MESESIPSGEEPYLYFLQFFSVFSPDILIGIGVILVLLILSALISGSEVAFFSMSPKNMEELKENQHPKDKYILELLDRPRFLLSTILISNNLINVSIIIIANFVLSAILPSTHHVVQLLVNVVLVTTLLVFFGEVAPKVFATQNNLTLARFTSGFIKLLRTLFYPISWILVKTGLIVEKKFQERSKEIDIEEIEKAIELSSNNGSSREDVAILKGIVKFGNTSVRQIMNPRIDIVALDITQPYNEVMDEVRKSGYSRMPVYNETIDKIEGILYIKDILEHLDEKEDFAWQKLLREPMFVPETKKIDDLLKEIQESRTHLAIVVDEYGGTSGLVTLEDILEEVIGDIKDEFDEEIEQEFRQLNEDTYLLDGKIALNDLCKILKIDNDTFDEAKGESDTLAGLLLELLGEIPRKGAKISYQNFNFTVLDIERNRIQKVKMQIV
jgi:putative hemolysin